jgi:threonine/homoserine/homoserine lactone efflux protein
MQWQEFLALMALASAMSFTPGPNTTLSAALAGNVGLRRTLPFIGSVAVGWGGLLGICALGAGALLAALPLLEWLLRGAGAAFLLWLAWRLLARPAAHAESASQLQVTFWQGAVLQFVNIKAWMLALAIASGWIIGRPDALQRFAIVLPLMMAYALASNLSYALAGALLRDWLAGPDGTARRRRWFNAAMALLLAATAVWVVWR